MSTHISAAVPYGPVACIPQSEKQLKPECSHQKSPWKAHVQQTPLLGACSHQITALKCFLTEDM